MRKLSLLCDRVYLRHLDRRNADGLGPFHSATKNTRYRATRVFLGLSVFEADTVTTNRRRNYYGLFQAADASVPLFYPPAGTPGAISNRNVRKPLQGVGKRSLLDLRTVGEVAERFLRARATPTQQSSREEADGGRNTDRDALHQAVRGGHKERWRTI